ncbi:sensor domain-containing diguanylate cyclase [Shewanella acanthi]|uniref:sensor domain-containing diguanylate cyclase n=1 Tax=Shewanella acanthi TaxID=2864212 RepID=UPI001C66043D|nr:sensor domain-containing diguanylate cyclase [Shewanella acanthi]QYJ80528.1 diguanylate cyclase [Shewanella acanthi]
MKSERYTYLSHVVDLLLDAICVVDPEGHFEYVSPGAERIFGYSPEEMLGMQMLDLVYPDDREATKAVVKNIMAGRSQVDFENRYIRKDGSLVDVLWSAKWSKESQQRIAVVRDITKRKDTERRQAALYEISEAVHVTEDLLALYRRIHQIIAKLLPAANFAIAIYDQVLDQFSFPYRMFAVKTSPSQAENIEHFAGQIIHSGEAQLACPLNNSTERCQTGGLCSLEMSWLGIPLKLQKGVIGAIILQSTSSDFSYSCKDCELLEFVSTQIAFAIERRQMLSRLEHIALYDQLTHLPNRELFCDRIHKALSRANRDSSYFSLLYLDLDKFKWVNDTFGHSAGDLLLQQTAQRILSCVRDVDTVARFGGDEFVILLERVDSAQNTLIAAQKIQQALNIPFELGEAQVSIFPSIGIALYPEHGKDEWQLLSCADAAMYKAKKSGGNRIELGYQGMKNKHVAPLFNPVIQELVNKKRLRDK